VVGREWQGWHGRGWGGYGFQLLEKLEIDFFQLPDGLTNLSEGVIETVA